MTSVERTAYRVSRRLMTACEPNAFAGPVAPSCPEAAVKTLMFAYLAEELRAGDIGQGVTCCGGSPPVQRCR
ncbi:hypothetical protein GCM10020216_108840 [Nonomuraea helvata]